MAWSRSSTTRRSSRPPSPIATGIAWYHDAEHGELRYWPDGPDADPVVHPVRANTALVLDTDSVFHGVDPVAPGVEAPSTAVGAGLNAGADGRWTLTRPDGEPITTYDWDELRLSVSWKAYCFADEAEHHVWQHHTDDLTTSAVVERLVADLVEREVVAPDVAIDRALGLRMIDEYVRYPGVPAPV